MFSGITMEADKLWSLLFAGPPFHDGFFRVSSFIVGSRRSWLLDLSSAPKTRPGLGFQGQATCSKPIRV